MSYGRFNAKAKWQVQSDARFIDIGLSQLPYIPHLIYKKHKDQLVIISVKIVDVILFPSVP